MQMNKIDGIVNPAGRSSLVALANDWLRARLTEWRTYRTQKLLLDLTDDRLHDIGLTREVVARMGWKNR